MRKVFAVFLSILLMVTVCVPVSAAGAGKFLRQDYEITDTTLQIMGTGLPQGGSLQVSIGSQKDIASELLTVREAGLGTTFYCLVDVSGSMSPEQMTQMKSVLSAISKEMKDGDNMVLASLGDEVAVGELLSDRAKRDQAIDALEAGSKYTNLYQGIMDSIRLLSTSTAYHKNRCLLILSDGEDDHQTGATEKEAEDAISASTVPVYAVAILRGNAGKTEQEFGKLLRSFATVSIGGQGYTPVVDGMDSAAVGAAVWNSMQENSVIRAELKDLSYDDSKDSLLFKATYETPEMKYEDTVTLYTADLPQELQTSPEEPDFSYPPPDLHTAEPTATPEVIINPGPDSPFPWWIVIAAGAVLAAAGAIFFVVKGSRLKTHEDAPAESDEKPSDIVSQENSEQMSDAQKEAPYEDMQQAVSLWSVQEAGALPGSRCEVVLTAIGYENQRFSFVLNKGDAKTLGRNGKADIVLDSEDYKLSGLHCELEWDGSKLYVKDRESKNGTFVNGVPIHHKTWMPLEDNSTLRIGSYEYRVKLTEGIA